MGRSRKHELDGEQVERLLAGAADASRPAEPLGEVVRVLRDAGLEPPSEAVAARHLAAIHAEVRRPSRPSTAAAPHRTPVRALIPRRLTAGVAGLTSVVALAFAGALPGVVQAAASDVLDVVGLTLPDGRERPDAAAPVVLPTAPSGQAPQPGPDAGEGPAEALRNERRDLGPGGPSSNPAGGSDDRTAAPEDARDAGEQGERDDDRERSGPGERDGDAEPSDDRDGDDGRGDDREPEPRDDADDDDSPTAPTERDEDAPDDEEAAVDEDASDDDEDASTRRGLQAPGFLGDEREAPVTPEPGADREASRGGSAPAPDAEGDPEP